MSSAIQPLTSVALGTIATVAEIMRAAGALNWEHKRITLPRIAVDTTS